MKILKKSRTTSLNSKFTGSYRKVYSNSITILYCEIPNVSKASQKGNFQFYNFFYKIIQLWFLCTTKFKCDSRSS